MAHVLYIFCFSLHLSWVFYFFYYRIWGWFIYLLIYFLFGCDGSYLWHVGSSSLMRDQTRAPCIGSTEFYSLDHQQSPNYTIFKLQRALLVAQLAKNPPSMRETWA